jgi:hypothetical protein
METKKTQVESFLKDLKSKIDVFQIIFPATRENFIETLKKLDYVTNQCIQVIKDLTYKDYYQGPFDDTINSGVYWEFGVTIKNMEIYIKINIGKLNKQVICISFHEAQFKINYPLKDK